MRLPVESGKRLKRMAERFGWTPSDASARLDAFKRLEPAGIVTVVTGARRTWV
jgi:hypothetical protein